MPVEYVLEDNVLTQKDPNDMYARVVNARSRTKADLAKAISERNIGISMPEALAMLEAAAEIMLEWLVNGDSINMRLAHYHHSVPGSFHEGEFPREAAIRITASKEVAELAKTIPLRRVEPVNPIRVESVHDVKSDTQNSMITSGGSVKVKGHNIRVAGTEPTVGVEFVNADNPAYVYPVPAEDLVVNNPSELIVIAPAMSSGEEVLLKITTQYSNGVKDLKTPHSTTFVKKLTVV
jgi:hypothetical protein